MGVCSGHFDDPDGHLWKVASATGGPAVCRIAGPDRTPLLFPRRFWAGLADGTVTVAFRRWKRPSVKAGGTLQSPGGLLGIDELEPIDPDDVTDERRPGRRLRHPRTKPSPTCDPTEPSTGSASTASATTQGRSSVATTPSAADEIDDLQARCAASNGRSPPCSSSPATRPWSARLAAVAGVERQQFKTRVRRLKALGLTESLEIGYRLSPRGRAFLAAADPPRT